MAHKPPEKDKVSKKAAARPLCLETKWKSSKSKTRRKAIIQKLLGLRPKFAGKVTIPLPDVAKADDYTRIEDIMRDLLTGHAAVY